MYFFLIAYSVLGAGIKYIDDAFDEKTFNKYIAFTLAPLLSIIGAYAMIADPASASILLAVMAGVLIKGKIDNYAFIIGFVTVLALVIIVGIQFLIIPLILLSAAAMLDEVGNDFVDKKRKKFNENKITHKFIIMFFGHRWIMKTAILYLAITGIIPLYLFFAMVFFDYSYLGVTWYSMFVKNRTTPVLLRPAVYKFGYLFK